MNIQCCPRCGGRVRSETIGWKCERCLGFIDMQGGFHEHIERPFLPPMTNADRLRRMTDEELAEFLEGEYGNFETGKALAWLQEIAKEA